MIYFSIIFSCLILWLTYTYFKTNYWGIKCGNLPDQLLAWDKFQGGDYYLKFVFNGRIFKLRGDGTCWDFYPEGTEVDNYDLIEQAMKYDKQIRWGYCDHLIQRPD